MEPVPNRASKLNSSGSLEDLISSYQAAKDAGRAKYQARKNDTRKPGQKRHKHEFDDAGGSISGPCVFDGCNAYIEHSVDVDPSGRINRYAEVKQAKYNPGSRPDLGY
jgi:hypothetical protein